MVFDAAVFFLQKLLIQAPWFIRYATYWTSRPLLQFERLLSPSNVEEELNAILRMHGAAILNRA
jgi:hypothetical protein